MYYNIFILQTITEKMGNDADVGVDGSQQEKRQLHVDVLCIFFGIGTWLCVNGLWVELPLLVQHLPEGWALPSYMAVIIQMANLGPISYTVLNSFFPNQVTERRSIYFVMTLGLVSIILLAQFWNKVLPIFGKSHSIALFGNLVKT
jgi:riboflavin transporter 2